MPTIGFIGGGNMAMSLIGGLINAGFERSDITVAEPGDEQRQLLTEKFGINTSANNDDTLDCDAVVLAVKPQLLKTVCHQLDNAGTQGTLFISIAAGVRSTDIARWLNSGSTQTQHGASLAIVRCMPNTPALLQCGASGLFANAEVTAQQKQQAETLMKAVGLVVWVDEESQLNAVTAVSGSGPAYYFLMMEAMQEAAEKLGLSAEVAQKLVIQTALGAARMAAESPAEPGELRRNVTSRGGTTEQAILSFQTDSFEQIVSHAMQAANDRSISLADELGSD